MKRRKEEKEKGGERRRGGRRKKRKEEKEEEEGKKEERERKGKMRRRIDGEKRGRTRNTSQRGIPIGINTSTLRQPYDIIFNKKLSQLKVP